MTTKDDIDLTELSQEDTLEDNDADATVVVEIVPDDEEFEEFEDDMAPSLDILAALNKPTPNADSGDLIATDPLTTYLSRLRNIEPLSPAKQQILAQRYIKDGDAEAAKLLILTNMRLVVKIAREYQRRWINLLDLVQEGNVGLAEAVTRYDPYRGVKFTSYAQYWIRAMILNYMMNQLHPVKIGSSRAGRKLFYNLQKARRELIKQGHNNPTTALIADYLDVPEKEVVRVAAQLDAPPVYMDAQAPGFEGSTTIGELMSDDGTIDPETLAGERQLTTQISGAIKEFGEAIDDDRHRAIWFERMIAEDAKSLVELGDEWGVSKERIRQIESQIRDKFRKYLVGELGEDIKINFFEDR